MLLKDFYTVYEFEFINNMVSAVIELNADHEIYKGHFPDMPVVPGVCMMTICKDMLSKALNSQLLLAESKSVKFLDVVNPKLQKRLKVDISILNNEENLVKVKCQLSNSEKVCYKAVSTYSVA